MVNLIASPFHIEDIKKIKQVGANSIVVGTPFYSVRSVTRLSEEELKQVKQMCVKEDLQLYVLVNRFFLEHELDKLQQHLKMLKELEVDGIYFTDLAVFYEAKKLGIHNRLIYNPDTLLTNHNDIQAYLNLGIKMCTLAKEITLEDMESIAHNVKGELEVLIHGRLNMLHSKRALLSNYFEFLNRSEDIQNKTSLYLMEEKRDEHMPIMEDDAGTHIFTGFTLASFEEVNDLIDSGIHNLKIESMFMNIEEVCQIIKDYKLVIDKEVKGRDMFKDYEVNHKDENITKGYLYTKTEAKK